VERDDQWRKGELAAAAVCYAYPALVKAAFLWSFNHTYWKPTPDNRIRELEKAGVLIAAEIDRL
jgi:hypothetical protein